MSKAKKPSKKSTTPEVKSEAEAKPAKKAARKVEVRPEPAPAAPSAEVAALRDEITALRAALNEKLAKWRAMGGSMTSTESPTVRQVLDLLRRPEGATKQELVEATGAKKGYVDALLSRILPEKGYQVAGEVREGGRVKAYRVPSED